MVAARLETSLTVRGLVANVYVQLKRARLTFGHGITNAWDEAVYLVLHALKLPLDQLTPVLARQVTAAECNRIAQLIAARVRHRVPAAYLTREAWLGEFRFYIDERVIVPRSFIADLLHERLAPWLPQPSRIKSALDLCTGSGCLAILAAKAYPAALIDAADISTAALAVARRNVAAYRLQRRVHLHKSDMFSALGNKRYDLIIANPPYVSARVMRELPREYRHEPRLALAGGKDGFDCVRVILRKAASHLSPRGLLVVEIGHHRKRLEAAFPRLPFIWPRTGGGDDCVFILQRGDLPGAAAPEAAKAPLRASRAGGRSHRR